MSEGKEPYYISIGGDVRCADTTKATIDDLDRIVRCAQELSGIDFHPGAVRRVIEALRLIESHNETGEWRAGVDFMQETACEALSALNLPPEWKP